MILLSVMEMRTQKEKHSGHGKAGAGAKREGMDWHKRTIFIHLRLLHSDSVAWCLW